MENENTAKQQKLVEFLSKVQREAEREEFIYGVTNRAKRNIFQRAVDFFIDRRKVSTKEKAYFFELLATMLHAGIPLNQALKILATKTSHPRLRRIIATLSYELEHGKLFSQALERFPDVFEETEQGVVRSAEAVGNLEFMLSKIARNLDRKSDLMMRLTSAFIYPIAVLVALSLGIIIMLIFVVPRIQEIFAASALALPLPTRLMLQGGVFMKDFWWLVLIAILFGISAFHISTHSDQGHFSWDFRKLRFPLAGEILRKIFVIRFTSTLGLLVESGLPITQALEFTAGAVGNEAYRVKTYEALGQIHEGKKLSEALAQAPFLFPETVTNMIAIGEQAASLGDISQKISDHYEKEIDYTLKNMTTILGPMLILFTGILVAFFALSVLSPIFSLTQAVG